MGWSRQKVPVDASKRICHILLEAPIHLLKCSVLLIDITPQLISEGGV